ncbi:hypothetical protein NW768_011337 [Fusarium equiseti]|uniref:Uncharacterized protein n=1 Tax=Fusarium equiseti TaxID=61235 RepID=A0ABQ8QXZ6_FUSEQ|nr:hypothetical protein NW768_011337 [Fusarium equiseti]
MDDPKHIRHQHFHQGVYSANTEADGRWQFTLKDLAGLLPITPTYNDRKFTGIYMPFYTHMKDINPEDIGAYAGQFQVSLWGQQTDHDLNTSNRANKGPHYYIALRAPDSCRNAVPIILLDWTDTSISSDVFHLAERTVVLLLNSYTSDMMSVNEGVQGDVDMHIMMRTRALLMGRPSDEARRASGWPLLSPVDATGSAQPSSSTWSISRYST